MISCLQKFVLSMSTGRCGLRRSEGAQMGWRRTSQFLASDDGPTAVEYAVVLSLLMAVFVASINFGQKLQANFSKSGTAIHAATK